MENSTSESDQNLTRRERQIMDCIYARGEVTVNDVQAVLPDPPAHTAVRTMLKILGDKNLIKRRKKGREFLYSARTERVHAGQSALSRVVETFFDGSLGSAVGAYLSQKETRLSEDELHQLRKMIEKAEREGR